MRCRSLVVLFREGHASVSYALELPPEPVLASFDRRLLTQAVTNLVKNATEAVETGSAAGGSDERKGRVEVKVRRESNMLAIDVIDNGPGLPKQNRARLLEPYVTTKGHKGTGLGLAIVQKITEQHGGELLLDDAPPAPDGQQARASRISLPLSILDSRRGRRMPHLIQTEPPMPAARLIDDVTLRSMSMAADILIVDDEADIRELVAGILEDEGHRTRAGARQRRGACASSRSGGRSSSSSTSGCRAAGSTGSRCCPSSSGPIRICRW